MNRLSNAWRGRPPLAPIVELPVFEGLEMFRWKFRAGAFCPVRWFTGKPEVRCCPIWPTHNPLICRGGGVAVMCARSASANVCADLAAAGTRPGTLSPRLRCSAVCQLNTRPAVMTTPRSMTFCSSRMLPGQSWYSRAAITSSGILSTTLPCCRANFWTKYSASNGISRLGALEAVGASSESRLVCNRGPRGTASHGSSVPGPDSSRRSL